MMRCYVEFLYPGSPFPETSLMLVKKRDPSKIKLPKGAFGFRFFDRTEGVLDGEIVFGKERHSSSYFYKGEVFTLEQVKALKGDHRILISNMEGNGYERVVKTVCGNWRPLEEGDQVI